MHNVRIIKQCFDSHLLCDVCLNVQIKSKSVEKIGSMIVNVSIQAYYHDLETGLIQSDNLENFTIT